VRYLSSGLSATKATPASGGGAGSGAMARRVCRSCDAAAPRVEGDDSHAIQTCDGTRRCRRGYRETVVGATTTWLYRPAENRPPWRRSVSMKVSEAERGPGGNCATGPGLLLT
jgi:hypothetical protein